MQELSLSDCALLAAAVSDCPLCVCCPLQDHLAHIIDQCEQLSIRPEQVCALFGNIEDIYEFNRCSTQLT